MTSSKLVLIVDDEAEFREIFSLSLKAAGFTVLTASSGEEGLAVIRERKPDLVLLDMNMPDMSGADVLLKLKAEPAIAATKVLFVSSLGAVEPQGQMVNSMAAQQIGAIGYEKKGEDLEKLVARVRTEIGA
jgi:two-component system, cell cycle response regulator